MKSAFLAAIKTFVETVKANNLELAKAKLEKAGYTVEPKQVEKKENE